MIAKSEGGKLTVLLATTVALALLAGVGPVASLAADDKPDFTLARFLEVPTLYSVKVSPDGSKVAWLQSRRDLADDKRVTRLWMADLKDGQPRQMTFVDSGVGRIAWRPDGSLSFTRKHDDDYQVWINPLDGSEPRPVTDHEGGVGAYWWSPDGKYLAVLADPAEPEAEEGDEESDELDPMDAQVYEVEEDRQDWTVWDRIELPGEYQQLWIIAATDADHDFEPRQLTASPLHPYHAAWAPDGKTLALTFNARFSSLVDEEQQIGLVDVATGEMEVLTPSTHHSSLAAFSPDGSQLAYYTDRDEELRAYLNLKDVVVRDMETGETRVLTGETDLTLGGSGSTPAVAPLWDAKGENMFLPAAEGTTRDLYRLDANSGKLENVTKLAGSLDSMNLAGGRLAYVESALDKPGTLYALSLIHI